MAKKGNRIQVILECTEHKASGKPGTSRYVTTKNKKNTPDRIELKKYNPELLDKDRILAITKSDLLDSELKSEITKTLPKNIDSIFISSIAQQGLVKLKDLIWEKLNN